jgi:hypothetical protein
MRSIVKAIEFWVNPAGAKNFDVASFRLLDLSTLTTSGVDNLGLAL